MARFVDSTFPAGNISSYKSFPVYKWLPVLNRFSPHFPVYRAFRTEYWCHSNTPEFSVSAARRKQYILAKQVSYACHTVLAYSEFGIFRRIRFQKHSCFLRKSRIRMLARRWTGWRDVSVAADPVLFPSLSPTFIMYHSALHNASFHTASLNNPENKEQNKRTKFHDYRSRNGQQVLR